jgi:anti-anti-sigma factor
VSKLSIETSLDGAAAVLALGGELDLAGATVLEQELDRLDADAIVLDLRELEFMDSSGLRSIAVRALRARQQGRRFALVPGQAQVMRVFDITRMRERLDFVADAQDVRGST